MKLFKYGNNSRMSALFWIVSSELTERKRNKFVNNDNNVSLFWRLVMTMISQSVLVVVICYLYIYLDFNYSYYLFLLLPWLWWIKVITIIIIILFVH